MEVWAVSYDLRLIVWAQPLQGPQQPRFVHQGQGVAPCYGALESRWSSGVIGCRLLSNPSQ